ncbi:TIM barrel protein [Fulvivirgaceae bacterium BMA10]|uniref:TIM barrel protein n=1 Tax=Splendidivirga corallicola TaxID=3051826 RepID=A0ABT8L140_9BACT|nr:TIM barrel protein [Fulvivirgaceae bacterium BMA10]
MTNTKISEQFSVNKLNNNINHSVCRWCYDDIPLEALCEKAQDIGIKSVELLGPEDWKTLEKYGLTCAMANGSDLGIPKGFNDPKYHGQLKKDFLELIPKAADHGLKNIICFSGDRNGISDEVGLDNCAIGLEEIIKEAARYNVNIVMELLNSKVDHPDYQCDHTEWGVALAKKLGADNFKLLYDIYHMQIMEGDIIATIRENHQYIGHYHTGGVPGRNEIDETQELNYLAIMQAIVSTGFDGYVAQEFIPKGSDPLKSLERGIQICDVR